MFPGLNSLPRGRASSQSVKRMIKEGQIEKRGHSAAFLTWSKYVYFLIFSSHLVTVHVKMILAHG